MKKKDKLHISLKHARSTGQILLDMEPLLFELVETQELQKGDILALVSVWIDVHAPGCIEEYNAGGSPVMFYGAKK